MDTNLKKFYALFLVVICGFGILYMLQDFLNAIVSAVILSLIVYPIYEKVLKKTRKKELSAFIVILLVFLIIIVPVSAMAGTILNQINSFNPNTQNFEKYEDNLNKILWADISISSLFENFEYYIKNQAKETLPEIISFTSKFFLMSFITFFLMFYMLVQRDIFIDETLRILPFTRENSRQLLKESSKVTKAILIGQVLTAIIQGLLGMFSFIIAGINGAIFWGIVMIILSIIPVLGAFIIWLPAGLFLVLNGDVGMGIFVLVWGGLIVSQVDNIIRPKLVNKFANIHPVETFIGVFMGLATFGILGVVLGPLIISLFSTLLRIFKKEYVF